MIVAVSRGQETIYLGRRVNGKEQIVCAKTGKVVVEVDPAEFNNKPQNIGGGADNDQR